MIANGSGSSNQSDGSQTIPPDIGEIELDAKQPKQTAELEELQILEADEIDEHSIVDGPVLGDVRLESKFKLFAENRKCTNLSWHNLGLNIGSKRILREISGHVSSGKVCALMGPSGAGKSSLLNVLAGRIVPSRKKQVSGVVCVNGRKINPVDYRSNIAYVMQEDLLVATSTAREALEFSAKLRLPLSISRYIFRLFSPLSNALSSDAGKIKKLVDDLLHSLGLFHVQHTMIGSEAVRGLSGGEKKRVAIGVELITNPSLLFLDERKL